MSTPKAPSIDAGPPDHTPPPSLNGAALRNANVSKLFRFLGSDDDGEFGWSHIEKADYKPVDDSWRGVSRRVFVGETGESTRFHLRYFEIERGGYTTLEQHDHEHSIVVLRGRGQVQIGCEIRDVKFGDVVYISPNDAHQFKNDQDDEPFGFLCVVNAIRDRPKLADGNSCKICE